VNFLIDVWFTICECILMKNKIKNTRDLRILLGITLLQIAKEAGYKGITYISDFENGKKDCSMRLARAYHTVSKGKINLMEQVDQ
jgi:DNA-binding XRE family transcriptional regulator